MTSKRILCPKTVWVRVLAEADIEYQAYPIAQKKHVAEQRWWDLISSKLSKELGINVKDFGGFVRGAGGNHHLTRLRNLTVV